ncbi:SDR family oxidoreductase [uncultured Eubacterium sp.]|uniref:SDR family oxidoreductase n=1 Tax=uncultured Eubacterium sp. TaxID=165185 RepID=UPI00258F8560|nr:SDR family oxidoreductase [uncultured Eubacterium sp.]
MKKALITGGATGIGKATAILLQQNGYDVYITYNQTKPDYEVNTIKCNLENIDEIESAVESIGRVNLLVNNAGVSIIKMINDITVDDYEKMTAVNERAVYFASKFSALKMIREQSGAIINISSMWGQVGASCETLYSMTKAGIIGLTKALAKELAPSNITVNCIAPGIIDTRMNNMFDTEELKEEVPLGRLGTPEEIAQAVLFLAESPYITGQILGVNGGAII